MRYKPTYRSLYKDQFVSYLAHANRLFWKKFTDRPLESPIKNRAMRIVDYDRAMQQVMAYADATQKFEIDQRVFANKHSGFHVGCHGRIVNFRINYDYFRIQYDVIRDGSGTPVWFFEDELTPERKL